MRWPQREACIARWVAGLPPHLELHDYGCGERGLAQQIGSRRYFGIDRPGSGVDLEVDLNGDLTVIPVPGTRGARAAVVVGLLEYLDDVPRFVSWLAAGYSTVLLTYVCDRGAARLPEWRSRYTEQELLALLGQAFESVEARPDVYAEGDQSAFSCRSRVPMWTTIAGEGRVNHGNDIIEAAIAGVLPGLRDSSTVLPLWSLGGMPPAPARTPLAFVPGSTSLGIQALVDWASRSDCPVFMLGGSALGATEAQLAFWRSSPRLRVFARDPVTAAVLGVPLVGCPTLFCPPLEDDLSVRGKTLFSISRVPVPAAFWGSRDFSSWVAVLHETADAALIPPVFGATRLLWEMTGLEALRMYQSAGAVVAGRLHGYLPALGRVPTWYYGDPSDARNSLVTHLGLKVHPAEALLTLDAAGLTEEHPVGLGTIHAAFVAAIEEIRQTWLEAAPTGAGS